MRLLTTFLLTLLAQLICNPANSSIEIYEYEQNTKNMAPVKEETQLAPMVVEGRSWEYISESYSNGTRFLDKLVLKIEGETTIEDKQYAVVNSYWNDNQTPIQDKPYCYLRETQDGKVYARTNPEFYYPTGQADASDGMEFLEDGSEFLLVDFNDIYASNTFYIVLYNMDGAIPYETYYYTNQTNTLKVWQLKETFKAEPGREIRLVEKVGYVWPDWPCGLLRPLTVMPTGADHSDWLYLQQVRDHDGSVVYQLDNMYSSSITVSADNTPAIYYDLQGRRLNPDALRPGIYIRQQGGTSSKVVIR